MDPFQERSAPDTFREDVRVTLRSPPSGRRRRDQFDRRNDAQCQSLLPELEFLASLVPSDEALRPVVAGVSRLAARAARSGGKAELFVELP